MIPDPELLRLYLEKSSQAAFTEMVERHVGLVYHAALRQLGGDADAAKDVAQTVFVDLARKAPELSSRQTVAGWLHTSTRFAAAKVRRSILTRQKYEKEAEAMHASDRNSASAHEWGKLRPVIDEVIAELSEPEREAVLMRFFSGYSYAQIGAALGLSDDAARMRVDRALEKLQGLLSRRQITSTGAALGIALAQHGALAVPPGLSEALSRGAFVTTGGATASGALTMVTVSNLLTIVAGLTLVFAIGTTIHQRGTSQAIRDKLAGDSAERDRLIAERQALEQTAARLESANANAVAVSASAPFGTAVRAAAPAERAWDDAAEGDAFMARHPEVKTALDAYANARVRFQFGAFIDTLPLSPEEKDRISMQMAKGIGMGAAGPSPDRQITLFTGRPGPAAPDLPDEQMARRFTEIRAENRWRDWVARLGAALWFTDAPLTPGQARQLIPVFSSSITTARGQPAQYDWEGLKSKARGALSDQQVEAITALQAEQQYNATLSRPLPAPPSDPRTSATPK